MSALDTRDPFTRLTGTRAKLPAVYVEDCLIGLVKQMACADLPVETAAETAAFVLGLAVTETELEHAQALYESWDAATRGWGVFAGAPARDRHYQADAAEDGLLLWARGASRSAIRDTARHLAVVS